MRLRLVPAADVFKLVAEVQGNGGFLVVGSAELVTFADNSRHRQAGEANMITVHQDWQGRGIARQLMEAKVDLADNWMQLARLSLKSDQKTPLRCISMSFIGYVAEGTVSDYAFGQGHYVDALMMGRVIRKRDSKAFQSEESSAGARWAAALVGPWRIESKKHPPVE